MPSDVAPDAGHPLVVTISAAYGAGGTVVGPDVATRLGLPYLERMVSHAVARAAEAIHKEAGGEGAWRRIMGAFASVPSAVTPSIPQPEDPVAVDELLREEVEATVRNAISQGGGVVVGRGATCFLASEPRTFHVRLDGPVERRAARAMKIERVELEEAQRRLGEVDRMRAAYAKRFYKRDLNDLSLYHLVLDSTSMPFEACAELIVQGAQAAFPLAV
jgi:cytidylate kinase